MARLLGRAPSEDRCRVGGPPDAGRRQHSLVYFHCRALKRPSLRWRDDRQHVPRHVIRVKASRARPIRHCDYRHLAQKAAGVADFNSFAKLEAINRSTTGPPHDGVSRARRLNLLNDLGSLCHGTVPVNEIALSVVTRERSDLPSMRDMDNRMISCSHVKGPLRSRHQTTVLQ